MKVQSDTIAPITIVARQTAITVPGAIAPGQIEDGKMKMKVRIVGCGDIAKNLEAMKRSLTRKTLTPVMRKNLKPMAEDMRETAPQGTGELAKSVRVSPRLNPAQQAKRERIAPIEMFVGPGPLPQAIAEEFGNARQAPRPFIRPAFDRGVDAALKGIAEDGVEAILAAVKKR